MRDAYRGRAAAYEKKGDYDRSVADYDMLVFSYAVELDAADPKADGYDDLLRAAIKAYRVRAACLRAKGDAGAALRDGKQAEKLEAKVRKPDEKGGTAAAAARPSPQVTVRNDWGQPLILFIAGVPYPFQAGETKTLPTPAGSFPIEMEAGPYRVKETMESGRSYSLTVSPAPRP